MGDVGAPAVEAGDDVEHLLQADRVRRAAPDVERMPADVRLVDVAPREQHARPKQVAAITVA